MNNILALPGSLKMTSKEIAEMTRKQHSHVLRDIDRLLENLNENNDPNLDSGFSVAYDGDPANGYRFFILDRDACYCLVTGYDAASRMRIIRRWQELESRNTLPDFNNPVAAARAWADQAEARQLAEQDAAAKTLALEAAQPAVEFAERVASAEDCHTLDEVAKMLQAGPRKFRQWLRDERFIRIDGTPYQEHLNRGLFKVIEKTIQLPHGFKIHAQTYVTGKGFQILQRRLDRTLIGETV